MYIITVPGKEKKGDKGWEKKYGHKEIFKAEINLSKVSLQEAMRLHKAAENGEKILLIIKKIK